MFLLSHCVTLSAQHRTVLSARHGAAQEFAEEELTFYMDALAGEKQPPLFQLEAGLELHSCCAC